MSKDMWFLALSDHYAVATFILPPKEVGSCPWQFLFDVLAIPEKCLDLQLLMQTFNEKSPIDS